MSSGYLERVVLGEARGVLPWLIRGLLWPLSLMYRAGLAAYLAIYSTGLRKRYRLPVPVISVGNLTFGGTGKTPAVQEVCRLLIEGGMRVVVLSRGHGGTARGSAVVSDGSEILADRAVAGDEPAMLAASLPGVPVVVGKNRRESGRLACSRFSPDVIVLDDGLQYWQLGRELDIVVVDSARPFGSGLVMPAGDLREPASGLGRAGVVLLNDTLGGGTYEAAARRVGRVAPGASVFRCLREPVAFARAVSNEALDLGWARGRRVAAFCGIGRPDAFFAMLEGLGAVMTEKVAFPDHHVFSDADVRRLSSTLESGSVDALVTTEKDAARLGTASALPELYVLRIRLKVEDRSRFGDCIFQRIEQASATASAAEEAH